MNLKFEGTLIRISNLEEKERIQQSHQNLVTEKAVSKSSKNKT